MTSFYKNSYSSIPKINVINNLSVEKHYMYGMSAIGSYQFFPNLSFGLGCTLNFHCITFSGESIKTLDGINPVTSSINSSYNILESSVNLVANYTI